ncbi:transmembrane protein 179 [Lingula anatina]|uniref:Transmembrane protein 179 n=1 Tax=Lingula anatina TaxID=7574 RepID=A0A1S3HR86_LINAN|nr:transmembrane protein 179 [Lingula anatina]|eukprot:XP_013388550.1 transmembrane protein 179 [Lingula anatina]
MGLGNVLVLSQVTGYLLLFIISFFLFIPLGSNQSQFLGHCLLFASGTWNETHDEITVSFGPDSGCDFSIFLGCVTCIASFFYFIWMSVHLYKDREPSWLTAFGAVLVSGTATVMTFASSITLSSGFSHWCNVITNNGARDSCEDSSFGDIKISNYPDIKTSGYFVQFGMAQFASWAVFLCWLVQAVMCGYQLYKYNRLENFLVSMNRERERLIQKVNPNRPTTI